MIACGGCSVDPSQKLLNDAMEGSVGGVRLALKMGGDVNHAWPGGKTTLMMACARAGQNEDTAERIVKILLESGADVNASDADDQTALGWAAASGRLDVVRVLTNAGADVNAQTVHHWTPLMAAVAGRNPLVVQHLLALGADPKVENDRGRTAMMEAEERGYDAIVRMLKAHAGQ